MSDPSTYVMGHTDRERRRLSLQAAVINPLTDSFLRRAGISGGMRVLELGCGVGEVTLITARLVGPHGRVTSLDIDPAAIEIAKQRVQSAGHRHVRFELADVLTFKPSQPFDAVVGRHILLHTPDAVAVLKRAVSLVHSGGVMAFQEFDFRSVPRGYPEMPVCFQAEELICEFFRRAVARPDIGAQLPWLMQEAGLPPPEARSESCIDGGPHSPLYEWLAETVRSLLPRMQALGIPGAADLDIDTLEERMRAEALSTRGYLVVVPMVGAFARKP